MNIDKLFRDRDLLDKEYNSFLQRKLLKKIQPDPDLIRAHLDKVKHNMLFFEKNKNESDYNLIFPPVFHWWLCGKIRVRKNLPEP